MLDLCFDMSTRGALRVAQRCGGSGRKGLGFVLSRTEAVSYTHLTLPTTERV